MLVLGLLLSAGGGCASYDQHVRLMREQFYASDLTGARETIDKVRKRHHKEGDVLALEQAIIALADGKPKEAEKTLRAVRDDFDYLEQQSAGELALSMITDDNRRSYAGEDYEKVLVRAFLAISNLMTDGGDAGAYALQVAEKQQQIIENGVDKQGENPKLAYQRLAVGAYIHGLLREQTHMNYDDAARDSAIVCSWQPDFPFGQQDLQRATNGRHSAPGNGVLYVFALVGRGPYKEQTVQMPTTAALLVADRILSATNKYTLPPTIAPVKVPKVIVPGCVVRDVRVSVDRQTVGSTATISDIGQMAVQQYDAIFPRVLARAVVRRVVKKGIVLGAKEATGQSAYTLGSVVARRCRHCLGSLRSRRHPLLEPAARQDPGAADRAAGRHASTGPRADDGLRHRRPQRSAGGDDRQRPQHLSLGQLSRQSPGRQGLDERAVTAAGHN